MGGTTIRIPKRVMESIWGFEDRRFIITKRCNKMSNIGSNLRVSGRIKPMPTMKGSVPIFSTNLTLHPRRRRVRWHLGEVLGWWKKLFRVKSLFSRSRRAEGRGMICRTGIVVGERRWDKRDICL